MSFMDVVDNVNIQPLPSLTAEHEVVAPDLVEFLLEVAATREGVVREALLEIVMEYIDEWLAKLKPVYIPGLVVEASRKKGWLPEVVEKVGASTIVEAMRLALLAKNAEGNVCDQLVEQLRLVENLLMASMGVEPGEVISSIISSNNCKAHASLIAALLVVKPSPEV